MDTSVIISLTALLIAFTSTVISYLMLRSQQDPEVIVYAIIDERRPSIINLIIENSGNGIAHTIKFTSNRWIPGRAFGIAEKDAKVPNKMNKGPLVSGISSLAPKEKRIITWGQYGGLKKGLCDEILTIKATYYGKPLLSLNRKKHETTSSIDLRSFEGNDSSDNNWDRKASEHLEKIAKSLSQLTDSHHRPDDEGDEGTNDEGTPLSN